MAAASLIALYRLAVFAAISASAILVVEYQNIGDPAFCGVESGCVEVARYAFTRMGGLPLPSIGLFAFAVLLTADLLSIPAADATPDDRARAERFGRFRLLASIAGGVAGVGLFALQALEIGAYCRFCLVVDASAAAAAILAVLRRRERVEEPANGFASFGWGGAAVLAVALPMVWGSYPQLPPLLPELQAKCVAGKVNIVQFTDFECPFCRALHGEIEALRKQHGDRVHLELVMAPLDSHRGAGPAARLWLCTPPDKRDLVAHTLYTTDPQNLTRVGMLGIAHALMPGVDVDGCLDAGETTLALAEQKALFDAVQASGLPHTLVGRRVVAGANVERLRKAVDAELRGETTMLAPAWLYALLAGVGVAASGLGLARPARRPAEPEPAPAPPEEPPAAPQKRKRKPRAR